ncbi:MAG: glycosyltransferase [Muribaculaceae bacterium]|nr:glycosyltransferase [Muribaculaceae bacterium]
MAITVLIGTFNSAKYIRKAIDCVRDYDEILIYDKGSTDDTVEIARQEGCKVIYTDGDDTDGYSAHNHAINKAKNEWILFLRPDELAPRELKKYLDEFIKNPGDTHGLFIPRRNFLMNKEDTNHYPDFQLRFFLRGGTIWNDDEAELPSVYGRTDRIPAHYRKFAIIRLPGSINDSIGHLEYSCQTQLDDPRKIPLMEILSTTMGTFMREYILKGKFKYGTIGYIDAVNTTMKQYFSLAKRHEKYAMEEINEKLKRP